MADQSDVETALVALASAALYPNGTDQTSICGAACRIYRGWPNPAALDADLASGRVNITVFPIENGIRNTTRYPDTWAASQPSPAPSLRAMSAGVSVTFGGTADVGQIAGILVDQKNYAYRTALNDTPELVAASLAELIRADRTAILLGASITIPGAGRVSGRVVVDVNATQEVRRQECRMRISCWCPTPAVRDTASAAIDMAMAGLRFIDLPDSTTARLIFQSTSVFDQSQDAALYRRDLIYAVEYATIISASQPAMLFGDLTVNAADFLA